MKKSDSCFEEQIVTYSLIVVDDDDIVVVVVLVVVGGDVDRVTKNNDHNDHGSLLHRNAVHH